MATQLQPILPEKLGAAIEEHIGAYIRDLVPADSNLTAEMRNITEPMALAGILREDLKNPEQRPRIDGFVERLNTILGAVVSLLSEADVGSIDPEMIQAKGLKTQFQRAVNDAYKQAGLEQPLPQEGLDRRGGL